MGVIFIGISNDIVIGIPMVSFCDIPISRASTFRQGEDDTGYGNYSIGLTKEWGLRNTINPILYVSNGGILNALQNYYAVIEQMKFDAEKMLEKDEKYIGQKQMNDFISNVFQYDKLIILGLIKTYKNKNHYINYNENEWRYVVCSDWMWGEEKCKEWRGPEGSHKPRSTFDALKFNVDDVNFIILKDKTDIPNFVTHINELKTFGGNEITEDGKKILLTKIITIEDIESNF